MSFADFYGKLVNHEKVMHLSVYVDNNDIKNMYVDSAEKHNKKIMDDPHFYDAGFDLFLPADTKFFGNTVTKVDFQIKCSAKIYGKNDSFFFTPFYTYARSSISKTPLRLANNQGIIDAGYRGSLIGMFDCIYDKEISYCVERNSRLLQICAPNLIPIYVNIVDTFEELGQSTSRGEGGFGSTGK